MIVKDQNNKEVYIRIYGDHEDDIQIDEAYYTENQSDVDDDTIEWLWNEYASEIYTEWYENQVGRAEDLWDRLMDR